MPDLTDVYITMETHYLKVALRNLLKYKAQTLVSLLGLALAFACVSLAAYWVHYERTFDAFQSNADRLYKIRSTSWGFDKTIPYVPFSVINHLQNDYPEVEAACAMHQLTYSKATVAGNTLPDGKVLQVTPEALKMFDMEWLEGDINAQVWGETKCAISDELAKRIGGAESPIGRTLVLGEEMEMAMKYEIAAVYKTWPKHSNFAFDVMMLYPMPREWTVCEVYALLKEGVNYEQFVRKLQTDTIRNSFHTIVPDIVTPLKALHYTHPEKELNVRMSDVRLFAGAAMLLAVCALLNYLVLFVSRLRTRGRDLALRTVCGASGWQLSRLLATEYLLLLLLSLLLGMVFVELSLNKFVELSMVEVERSAVWRACGALLVFIVFLAWLLSLAPIYYFKRQTLRQQMESSSVRAGKNYFRLTGVCVQLCIGLLFMFCSTVMIKQVYFLLHGDINIERKQIAAVYSHDGSDRLMDILRQLPCVVEMVPVEQSLYPFSVTSTIGNASEWDGKPANAAPVRYRKEAVNDDIARFYGLQMKEGSGTFDLGQDEVVVNEAFVRKMGMENPVGKRVAQCKIVGVIYDYQSQRPTEQPTPILFTKKYSESMWVAFKYSGSWQDCKRVVSQALDKAELTPFPYAEGSYLLEDGEENYKKYVKSEYNLLKLLNAITLVSLLIALFGIYALILQECERHRKEIAIRKVNGAQVKDILMMFFKQYMMQVVIAAAVAFPLGYALMKRWLQGYSRQTSIDIWVFFGIFVVTALLVTLCIGWRVWRAANENPARVIKKE